MKQILVLCILAFFCGSFAEQWDSRGLAVDDSLLIQNVWLNEDDKRAAATDNGWVKVAEGEPNPSTCSFPEITPSDTDGNEIIFFNLTGPPYVTFDGCGLWIHQKWQVMKLVGDEEHVGKGTTTYKLGQPTLKQIPLCADPKIGGTKLTYASSPPENMFRFYFPTECWGTNEYLATLSPAHSGFTYGATTFNLCPQLGTSTDGCLQNREVPANQFAIGIYDSDTDVISIRRGTATLDGKKWYTEYKTKFGYLYKCSDNTEINYPIGSLIGSFSRINSLSQTMDGSKVVCKVV